MLRFTLPCGAFCEPLVAFPLPLSSSLFGFHFNAACRFVFFPYLAVTNRTTVGCSSASIAIPEDVRNTAAQLFLPVPLAKVNTLPVSPKKLKLQGKIVAVSTRFFCRHALGGLNSFLFFSLAANCGFQLLASVQLYCRSSQHSALAHGHPQPLQVHSPCFFIHGATCTSLVPPFLCAHILGALGLLPFVFLLHCSALCFPCVSRIYAVGYIVLLASMLIRALASEHMCIPLLLSFP